jgi:hypothetical protein
VVWQIIPWNDKTNLMNEEARKLRIIAKVKKLNNEKQRSYYFRILKAIGSLYTFYRSGPTLCWCLPH